MFKCEGKCGSSALKPRRVVVERKMVTHVKTQTGPRGGIGSQIVRELLLCEGCAAGVAEIPVERNVPEKIVKKPAADASLSASVAEHLQ